MDYEIKVVWENTKIGYTTLRAFSCLYMTQSIVYNRLFSRFDELCKYAAEYA